MGQFWRWSRCLGRKALKITEVTLTLARMLSYREIYGPQLGFVQLQGRKSPAFTISQDLVFSDYLEITLNSECLARFLVLAYFALWVFAFQ